MARLTPEELVAFVERSCVQHGVPPKLDDQGVIARIAVLLRGDGDQSAAPRRAVDVPAPAAPQSNSDE
jgi:hypothetical protein